MNMPGFTAEAALPFNQRNRQLRSATNGVARDSVTVAANGLDSVDEEIEVACGPCRCRVRRLAKIPEIICSKICFSQRAGGCDSWSIPCVPWGF